MTHTPFIYAHPWAYAAVMRVLYGRYFSHRSRAIADLVPSGASVAEACAGDCRLYSRFLRSKGVHYVGLDISASFVAHAQARGVDARLHDLRRDEVPVADVVILQASLYQFWSQAEEIVAKLRRAARHRLIIAEPVRNLSCSSVKLLAGLSQRLTGVATGSTHDEHAQPSRFDEQSLRELFNATDGLERVFAIPGGREMVGVFRGVASSSVVGGR